MDVQPQRATAPSNYTAAHFEAASCSGLTQHWARFKNVCSYKLLKQENMGKLLLCPFCHEGKVMVWVKRWLGSWCKETSVDRWSGAWQQSNGPRPVFYWGVYSPAGSSSTTLLLTGTMLQPLSAVSLLVFGNLKLQILCNFFGGQSEKLLKGNILETHTEHVTAVAPSQLLCSWMQVLISVFQTWCDVG